MIYPQVLWSLVVCFFFFSRVCFVAGHFKSRRRGLISDMMLWDCYTKQFNEMIKEKESLDSQLSSQLHAALLLSMNMIVGWPHNFSDDSDIVSCSVNIFFLNL